jgi:hypothetical protein
MCHGDCEMSYSEKIDPKMMKCNGMEITKAKGVSTFYKK